MCQISSVGQGGVSEVEWIEMRDRAERDSRAGWNGIWGWTESR